VRSTGIGENNLRLLLGALSDRNLEPSKIAGNYHKSKLSIKYIVSLSNRRPVVIPGRRHSTCRWPGLAQVGHLQFRQRNSV